MDGREEKGKESTKLIGVGELRELPRAFNIWVQEHSLKTVL